MSKVKKKYLKVAEIYKRFAKDYKSFDFSDSALEAMYNYESTGTGTVDFKNGYYQGKHLMDLTIKMWRKDIKDGLLTKYELYQDYPAWFLDKVLKGCVMDKKPIFGITITDVKYYEVQKAGA